MPCPALGPCRGLPTAAYPGRSVFPPWGRGEACFSSPLRNRASETHNAAVKISGSGWAATQWPLVRLAEGGLLEEPSWERAAAGSVLVQGWGGGEGQGETSGLGGFCSFGTLQGGRGWTVGIAIEQDGMFQKGTNLRLSTLNSSQRHLSGWGRGRKEIGEEGAVTGQIVQSPAGLLLLRWPPSTAWDRSSCPSGQAGGSLAQAASMIMLELGTSSCQA